MHFPRGKRPHFLDPSMRLLPDVLPPPPSPPPHHPPKPVEALLHQNRARAAEPGPLTSTARYKREDDIPTAVVIRALRALEAVAWDEVAPDEVAPDESPLVS